MTNILFLNTTGAKLQVALFANGTVASYVGQEDAKRHNYVLLEVLDNLFAQKNITAKQLTHIVCVSGPGSFTGIRVGASFANALSRSSGAKLFAVTSLEFLGHGNRIVTMDCKHGNFYTMTERDGEREYDELTEAQIAKIDLPRVESVENSLADLVAYGTKLVQEGAEAIDLIRPFYLKKSSAEREYAERELTKTEFLEPQNEE